MKRQSSVLAEKRQALLELEEKLGREKREVESEKEAVLNERAKVQELRIKLKEAADEVSRLEEVRTLFSHDCVAHLLVFSTLLRREKRADRRCTKQR